MEVRFASTSWPYFTISLLRGACDAADSTTVQAELEKLQKMKEEFVMREEQLEQQCLKVRQCLKNVTDDPATNRYP